MDDSARFKEELERLKAKYRKEALRAVATAEAEGYERGKLEVKDAAEKMIAQWKAVAEAVTSNDSGQSKPVLLVQHIMQKIYSEFKQECANETEIPMSKLKVRLPTSFTLSFLLKCCDDTLYYKTGHSSSQHRKADGKFARTGVVKLNHQKQTRYTKFYRIAITKFNHQLLLRRLQYPRRSDCISIKWWSRHVSVVCLRTSTNIG